MWSGNPCTSLGCPGQGSRGRSQFGPSVGWCPAPATSIARSKGEKVTIQPWDPYVSTIRWQESCPSPPPRKKNKTAKRKVFNHAVIMSILSLPSPSKEPNLKPTDWCCGWPAGRQWVKAKVPGWLSRSPCHCHPPLCKDEP